MAKDRAAAVTTTVLAIISSALRELMLRGGGPTDERFFAGSLPTSPARCAVLVAPFVERHDAGLRARGWEQECLQRPIDDAAWEKELKRRRDIEPWRAREYSAA
jgi:hypothetical protein